jgi:hypothetical protein
VEDAAGLTVRMQMTKAGSKLNKSLLHGNLINPCHDRVDYCVRGYAYVDNLSGQNGAPG